MAGIRDIDFSAEWKFRTSRSSGSGGQHVNKTESRVELLFDVSNSSLLTDDQKLLLQTKLANRLDTAGLLHLVCETDRSQLRNKEEVIEKFYDLLERSLIVARPRKKSRPSRGAIQARLLAKKRASARKQDRRWRPEE